MSTEKRSRIKGQDTRKYTIRGVGGTKHYLFYIHRVRVGERIEEHPWSLARYLVNSMKVMVATQLPAESREGLAVFEFLQFWKSWSKYSVGYEMRMQEHSQARCWSLGRGRKSCNFSILYDDMRWFNSIGSSSVCAQQFLTAVSQRFSCKFVDACDTTHV